MKNSGFEICCQTWFVFQSGSPLCLILRQDSIGVKSYVCFWVQSIERIEVFVNESPQLGSFIEEHSKHFIASPEYELKEFIIEPWFYTNKNLSTKKAHFWKTTLFVWAYWNLLGCKTIKMLNNTAVSRIIVLREKNTNCEMRLFLVWHTSIPYKCLIPTEL